MVLRQLDTHMQENEVELMSYIKFNSEWIKDLNRSIKTIKLFEGTINIIFMTLD